MTEEINDCEVSEYDKTKQFYENDGKVLRTNIKMDGLPFLPGFHFNNVTKHDHRMSAQFRWKNGYALPKDRAIGIGKDPLDVDSIIFNKTSDGCKFKGYDPTLTYGKARDPPKPIFLPHFVQVDGKCLSFDGYTKQRDSEASLYSHRVRRVKITYFLVDDTISIKEPAFEDAGYAQGSLLKRGPIPNPHRKNRTWHWSDFNIGVELSFYGVTYRLCRCNDFTKNFLSNNGIKVGSDEPIPDDPYILDRRQQRQREQCKMTEEIDDCEVSEYDKTKQFYENDGKVLRFYTAWLDDTIEPPQWKYFVLLYFLVDDRVLIQGLKEMNCDQRLCSTFLSKIKLPVDRTNIPPDFPFIYMEPGCHEYEYYKLKDLIIGNTISVMSRRFLLYDCDPFTRNYFQQMWQIVQPEPIKIEDPNKNVASYQRVIPPHGIGIGDPDDTLQNCILLRPKPPKIVNVVQYVLNAHKKLRYKLKLIPVYEEDKLRNFIMEFCLGNDHISITERADKNSGFIGGRLMSSRRLRKPNTRIDDNIFYGTKDFAIGNKLFAHGLIFEIVEVDLWTYNYMIDHKFKFTQEAIDGAKSFLESKGLLNPEQENVSHDN